MPNKIDKLLTTTTQQNSKIKSCFFPETYQQSNIRHYRHNFEYNLYKKFKDLELGTNNIQFDVIGNILRQVGQTIQINCRQINYKNAYSGFWKIYSILHIIQSNKYINNIVGYRTFTLNYDPDEQKQ